LRYYSYIRLTELYINRLPIIVVNVLASAALAGVMKYTIIFVISVSLIINVHGRYPVRFPRLDSNARSARTF